jgi:hypothetical protein
MMRGAFVCCNGVLGSAYTASEDRESFLAGDTVSIVGTSTTSAHLALVTCGGHVDLLLVCAAGWHSPIRIRPLGMRECVVLATELIEAPNPERISRATVLPQVFFEAFELLEDVPTRRTGSAVVAMLDDEGCLLERGAKDSETFCGENAGT